MPDFEQKHLDLVARTNNHIKRLMNESIRKASEVLNGFEVHSSSNIWLRNLTRESKIERILEKLQADLYQTIRNAISQGWEIGDLSNDDLVNSYIEGLNLTGIQKQGLFARNSQALSSFLSRKENGFTISQRVWNIVNGQREMIDAYLSTGIASGRSAQGIARDLQQFLNDPDKRFRRIRDENGVLQLSEPAKNYHPGQGRYRSSFQNAYRLAQTEINMAYRYSDHERVQNIPFVTGITIHLSGSHPRIDICDYMAGDYPKEYKWGGWHPRCICYKTSILLPRSEIRAYVSTGEVPDRLKVKNIPRSASNYLRQNNDAIAGYKNKPYFIRDNHKISDGKIILDL